MTETVHLRRTSQRHRAGISPIPIPWSGPIDNLDRFHRDRGLEPLGVQKAAHHFLWRIHASFFVSHWTRGTLSLQSGQITKWIRIISSVGAPVEMLDQSPSSTASHQDGHYALTRHCLARLRSVLKAPSRLGSGPRTVHDASRLPSPWSGKLLDTTMARAVSVALFAAGKMKICICLRFLDTVLSFDQNRQRFQTLFNILNISSFLKHLIILVAVI